MTAALLVHPLAARAVTCPHCDARGGEPCKSTGGGNYAQTVTHKARLARVAGFAAEQAAAAVALVREIGRHWWGQADQFTEFEAIAAPISQAKTEKRPSPRGVRLSERQAEEIERVVYCGGELWAPTSHFSGEAAERQTAQALEAKGIVVYDRLSDDGYDRIYRLTAFGWQVYRQHRLIIRRLSDAEVDTAEAAARADLVRRTAAALVVA